MLTHHWVGCKVVVIHLWVHHFTAIGYIAVTISSGSIVIVGVLIVHRMNYI